MKRKYKNLSGYKNAFKGDHRKNQLPEKKFLLRNSVLTDLFESVSHVKTFHHLFTAIIICFGCSTMAHDYLIKKRMEFGVNLIHSGFAKFHIAAGSWLVLMLLSCLCYVCFTVWANLRSIIFPKSNFFKIWDSAGMLLVLGYYIFCFELSSFIVQKFRLPPPSACIVLVEQVRLSMKVHAFIRTSAEGVLKYKSHSDEELAIPKFSQYFYFLFAPTLVFRTEYPRTKQTRWRFVIHRALESSAVIICLSFTFHKFFIPTYNNFGLRRFTWNEIIVSFLEHSLPGRRTITAVPEG
ncbi:hypothetical protein JTB14_027956 [Gonioctena quinquepunctata]|nr:hypothetical protein JTB14_027956 [Gonioctena quinquepunctata]